MISDRIHHMAVVGAANMGAALAKCFLADGLDVSVWNRSAEKWLPLAKLGAFTSPDLNPVIQRSELVVVCLTDHQATTTVLFPDGAREAQRGKTLAQLSTVTREQSCQMAATCQLEDVLYLDGAIMGLSQRVREGDCIMAYSGPKGVYAHCKRVLQAIGNRPMHVSESFGAAPDLELARFTYIYGAWLAYFQSLALCSAGDLPMEAFVQIIDDGEHIRNRTTRRYGEAIIQSDYGAPGATIDVHAAAFRHVLDKAHSLGLRSELIELIAGLLGEAKVQGHGRQQLPAMFEVIVGMHQAIVH